MPEYCGETHFTREELVQNNKISENHTAVELYPKRPRYEVIYRTGDSKETISENCKSAVSRGICTFAATHLNYTKQTGLVKTIFPKMENTIDRNLCFAGTHVALVTLQITRQCASFVAKNVTQGTMFRSQQRSRIFIGKTCYHILDYKWTAIKTVS